MTPPPLASLTLTRVATASDPLLSSTLSSCRHHRHLPLFFLHQDRGVSTSYMLVLHNGQIA
jgi:hypothetical protein